MVFAECIGIIGTDQIIEVDIADRILPVSDKLFLSLRAECFDRAPKVISLSADKCDLPDRLYGLFPGRVENRGVRFYPQTDYGCGNPEADGQTQISFRRRITE